EASRRHPAKSHVKETRPSWFGCACCPPNLARTLTSLNNYVTSVHDNAIYIHLLTDFEGDIELDSQTISLTQTTDISDKGKVTIDVKGVTEPVKIYLRLPEWGDTYVLENNTSVDKGYAEFILNKDREVTMECGLPVHVLESHPLVRNNRGKVAIQRGPFVYCIEGEDNGENLHLLTLTDTPVAEAVSDDELG